MRKSKIRKLLLLVILFESTSCLSIHSEQQEVKELAQDYMTMPQLNGSVLVAPSSEKLSEKVAVLINSAEEYQFSPQLLLFTQ